MWGSILCLPTFIFFIYQTKTFLTRPTAPDCNCTFIPWGWFADLVRILLTTPPVNLAVRWSCFWTTLTFWPIWICFLFLPSSLSFSINSSLPKMYANGLILRSSPFQNGLVPYIWLAWARFWIIIILFNFFYSSWERQSIWVFVLYILCSHCHTWQNSIFLLSLLLDENIEPLLCLEKQIILIPQPYQSPHR